MFMHVQRSLKQRTQWKFKNKENSLITKPLSTEFKN